ncbi:hypothetical protein ACFCYN_18970 [Gottfriedia sp. NPDC056225]|uniref:hypothetical protein n=1 Tax=Gottfriedia sp. NPDC056225 TaxID=3345751 RepID=UPI00155863E1|nr:hypothetical protein HPK19_06910 [Arthrobacter citreus]
MSNLLRITLPGLAIFIFILIDTMNPESKNIIVGIYLFFPLVFIAQGIISASSKKILIIGILTSSLAVILPISYLYNMGTMLIPVIIYILLGLLFFFISRVNKGKSSLP